MSSKTLHKTITLPNGIEIFYRSAGSPSKPTILLLHGFPSSSHQYRNLIPLLSPSYHIIAPDLPGFGFTTVPSTLDYSYTFANLTSTLSSFLSTLSLSNLTIYIFDYGAPIALRLLLNQGSTITIRALISQNGNAYNDGLSPFWDPLRSYWATPSPSPSLLAELSSSLLSPSATKGQYTTGTPADRLALIGPESYTLDSALMAAPGNATIQLGLLRDYASNVELYPRFQAALRDSRLPLLALWGRNDPIFAAAGAEAFKRDLPGAVVEFLDAGHFAVETHGEEIAERVLGFMREVGI